MGCSCEITPTGKCSVSVVQISNFGSAGQSVEKHPMGPRFSKRSDFVFYLEHLVGPALFPQETLYVRRISKNTISMVYSSPLLCTPLSLLSPSFPFLLLKLFLHLSLSSITPFHISQIPKSNQNPSLPSTIPVSLSFPLLAQSLSLYGFATWTKIYPSLLNPHLRFPSLLLSNNCPMIVSCLQMNE